MTSRSVERIPQHAWDPGRAEWTKWPAHPEPAGDATGGSPQGGLEPTRGAPPVGLRPRRGLLSELLAGSVLLAVWVFLWSFFLLAVVDPGSRLHRHGQRAAWVAGRGATALSGATAWGAVPRS